jgi:tetratricopeptide (TPR) repeat protein
MAASAKPFLVTPNRRTGIRPWMRPLLPIAFLALVYVALFTQHGIFGFGWNEIKTTLTVDESEQLDGASQGYIIAQQYQEALTPTLKLYRAYPENHIYIERLAQIYDHLGRYEDEAKYWERYLDLAPTPIAACPQIGEAYWKRGDAQEKQAISAYERCLAIDPLNADSIFYLGHALEMTGDFERAAATYQKGLQLSPEYTDLRLGLARSWLRLDKAGEAKSIVEDVLKKKADRSDALLLAGMISLHEDDYAKAKDYLTRGAAISSDPDFHVLLARIAEHQDDDAAALKEYTRLSELRPNDERVRKKRDALLDAQKKGTK